MGMGVPRLLAGVLTLLVLSRPALVNANTVAYGNLYGTTTDFLGVQETSLSLGDTAPLFGTPILSGNALFFTHMTFVSQASGAGGTDVTDGKLDTTIVSTNIPGYYIDHLRLQELGDTTLDGTGTSATRSSVACNIYLTVLALDDNSLPFAMIGTNLTLTDGGQWTLAGGPFTGKQWSGSLNFDMAPFLASFGITAHATEVAFTLENTLATSSELGTDAFIDKKAAGLSVTPVIVPEPGVFSLLVLSGVLLIVGRFGRNH